MDLRCVFQVAVNSLNQRVIYGVVSLIMSVHEFGNQRMTKGWTLSLSHPVTRLWNVYSTHLKPESLAGRCLDVRGGTLPPEERVRIPLDWKL